MLNGSKKKAHELNDEMDDSAVETQTTPNTNSAESGTDNTRMNINQKLQTEKEELEQRLREAEENCHAFEKKLQETKMDFEGVKQNLREAEQIELQNEALVNRLQSMSEELAEAEKLKKTIEAKDSALRHKDELVRIYAAVDLLFFFMYLSLYRNFF